MLRRYKGGMRNDIHNGRGRRESTFFDWRNWGLSLRAVVHPSLSRREAVVKNRTRADLACSRRTAYAPGALKRWSKAESAIQHRSAQSHTSSLFHVLGEGREDVTSGGSVGECLWTGGCVVVLIRTRACSILGLALTTHLLPLMTVCETLGLFCKT